MINTLAERLKLCMAGPPKISGVALAKACGISPPSVSEWLSGETKTIEGVNLINAAKFLDVDAEWLATGVGVKRSYRGHHAAQTLPTYGAISKEKYQAIQLIHTLPDDHLAEVIEFLEWKNHKASEKKDGHDLLLATPAAA